MIYSKIEASEAMINPLLHNTQLCLAKVAETCQDKSESKTTVESFNQIISQKNNYFQNTQTNQTTTGVGATSSYTSSQTYQSALQEIPLCKQTSLSQHIQLVQPLDYTQCYVNPHQPINIHQSQTQMINPIHYHPQQLQSPQMLVSNPQQMYSIPNFQLMQTPTQSPFNQYQMMYNPYYMGVQHQGNVIQPITNTQIGQFILPGQDLQSHLDDIPTHSQFPLILENQQSDKFMQNESNRKTLDMMKHNRLEKQQSFQEMQQGTQEQTNSCDISCQSNQQLINQRNEQRDRQTSENSNKLFIYDTLEVQKKRKLERAETNKMWQRGNNNKSDLRNEIEGKIQIEKMLSSIESNETNNDNLNNQQGRIPISNQNKDYQININRISESREAFNYNEKYNPSVNRLDNLHSRKKASKSNVCLFRKIKNNDPPVKVIWSIACDSIFGEQQGSSKNQSMNIPNYSQIHQAKLLYTTSNFPLNQIGNNQFSPNQENEYRTEIAKKQNENLLKKRKFHESPASIPQKHSSQGDAELNLQFNDSQSLNQKIVSQTRFTNYHNDEQKKTLNFYSSEANLKGEAFQVNSDSINVKSTCGNLQNYKMNLRIKQQMEKYSSNPDTQVQCIQKSQCESNSEDGVNKGGVHSSKSKLKHTLKQEHKSRVNSSNNGDFLQQYEDEEEWEDSFFQQMKQNTKSGGKSFFLVSNYKKKLIQQLSVEDQQILAQMKQSKKFNFSKNVIKQFLKVMSSEINYIYKLDDAKKTDRDEKQQQQVSQSKIDLIEGSTQNNCKNDTALQQICFNNSRDLLKREQHMAQINASSPALHQNSFVIHANNALNKSFNQNSKDKSIFQDYIQIKNPSTALLNQLRSKIKEFLTFNSYTHSSIKKIIVHNYYSLYFRDFLERYCDDWISQGKTKYKNEQKIMIQFLKLCLRNRKLLIFLSQHDPLRNSSANEEIEQD